MIESLEVMIAIVYLLGGIPKLRRGDSVGILVLYLELFVKTAVQLPSPSALDPSVD